MVWKERQRKGEKRKEFTMETYLVSQDNATQTDWNGVPNPIHRLYRTCIDCEVKKRERERESRGRRIM